ncbi:FABP family protein [Saccharopolyspora taberi]|uniref:Peroxynitrite isomerase n=1 Tax=Saccharopolyspora taberi TaxID=60895 RepID=A0ABN3V9E3_9PSEU
MLPIPDDTASPNGLHDICGPLLPLVGVWRAEGEVDYPTIDGPHRFGQQLVISHDGRPFLHHDARAWLLDEAGEVIRPAARETGWWRPQPDGRIELLLTHATGLLELFYGTAGEAEWELSTETVLRSASAKDVNAARRRYSLRPDGRLTYTEHRAMMGRPMTLHVSSVLERS